MKPTVGRIVLYRTRGGYDFAALVEAVENPEGFGLPPLPEGNVHLRIFVPPWGVPEAQDQQLGTPQAPPQGDIPGGTWRWPERVG